MTLSYALLAVAHALAGAAWFGAMFYSLTVLHPRATNYFQSDAEFEEFIATVSQGARWKVLPGLPLIGGTGAALLLLALRDSAAPVSRAWVAVIIAKLALFLAALVIFCYASWRLWPRRIFASPEELPSIRAKFRRVAMSL